MASPSMSDDFRLKIKRFLDERARQYLRNNTPTPLGPSQDSTWLTQEATAWQERDAKLFALAAEAAKTAGKK